MAKQWEAFKARVEGKRDEFVSTEDTEQLLVLVLQIVATLALDPANHAALADQGIPDALSQLLLPSDEWYYTNHSTRYARYVKHHAARSLVYMGLQHRVNLRISVYDILAEDVPPPTPLTESVEDSYISRTSAAPALVTCRSTKRIVGLSVEGAVVHILGAFEEEFISVYDPSGGFRIAKYVVRSPSVAKAIMMNHYRQILGSLESAIPGVRMSSWPFDHTRGALKVPKSWEAENEFPRNPLSADYVHPKKKSRL
ncbi:hypothetical protein J437_LFUL001111 [Ladona fulva]|uniref:Uncharacterized protein n=1 Tax=Ladona fulva TaxID=123851 RepID=A0A8K0JX40_LADFU|nr:hypothetical protein J437_LFUL001111 [Ladona fulva]